MILTSITRTSSCMVEHKTGLIHKSDSTLFCLVQFVKPNDGVQSVGPFWGVCHFWFCYVSFVFNCIGWLFWFRVGSWWDEDVLFWAIRLRYSFWVWRWFLVWCDGWCWVIFFVGLYRRRARCRWVGLWRSSTHQNWVGISFPWPLQRLGKSRVLTGSSPSYTLLPLSRTAENNTSWKSALGVFMERLPWLMKRPSTARGWRRCWP